MNKKVVLSVLATAVVASMATSAFAKPSQGLYIGGNIDKYYSITEFVTNEAAVINHINSAGFGNVLYVDDQGKAATITEIVNAADMNSVLEKAVLADFQGNTYTKSDGTTYDPSKDPDLGGATGELKVESVSAINGKTVVVKFNSAVQAGTATGGAQVETYYTVGGANPTRVTLNETKTEATLTFAAGFGANLDKYVQVDVANVKSADGKSTVSYTGSVLLSDKTAPAVKETVYSAPVVKVNFNEPIAATTVLTGATVAVDGVPITDASSPVSYSVTLDNTAGDALTGATGITIKGLSAGTHRIDIVGAKDLVNNFMPDFTTSVNVTADAVAPTVSSLTSEGSKIKLKFSEALKNATLNGQANKRVWLTLDGVNVYLDSTNQVDTAGLEYEYDATAEIGASTFKNIAVVVKAAGAQDLSGNPLAADFSSTLTLTKDSSAPTVVSTEAKDNKIIVKYNEALGTSPATAIAPNDTLTVKLVDKDGVIKDTTVTVGSVAYVYDANNDGDTTDAGENNYLVLTLADGTATDPVDDATDKLVQGSYTVTIPAGAVEDVPGTSTTTAAKVTFTVSGSGTGAATLNAVPAQVANTPGVLQFTFDDVLTNAALDRNKYTINGAALPEGTKLYFYNDMQTVRAELPAGAIAVSGTRTLAVKDIVDEDGDTLTTAAKTGVTANVLENVHPTASSVAIVSDKQIAIEMSENLGAVGAATGYEVYVGGVKVNTTANPLALSTAAGSKGASSKLLITATNANTFGAGQTVLVKFLEGNTIVDTTGNGNNVAVSQISN